MKHITYGDKSLLVGDQIADLLLECAALLTRVGSGDTDADYAAELSS